MRASVIAGLADEICGRDRHRRPERSATTMCSAITSRCRRATAKSLSRRLFPTATSTARPWRTRCVSRRRNLQGWPAASPRPPDRALEIELALFDELAAAVMAEAPALSRAASALAALDRCRRARRTRRRAPLRASPTSTASLASDIKGGRHPVVDSWRWRAPANNSCPTTATLARTIQARSCQEPTGPAMSRTALNQAPAARHHLKRASGCSPAPTWPASRHSCVRTR